MLQAIPSNVWDHVREEDKDTLVKELGAYFLGSFGSPERLDYGTGHELSFLAFVAAIWKLNGFAPSNGGNEERGIVIGVIDSLVISSKQNLPQVPLLSKFSATARLFAT